ncbi:tripartite tricarboxylate transporter TctB family protein [Halomonas salipaludis]|nr:tripartite tricarboxylate transporter TctB family protein [Halomonas salipaludis]
MEEGRQSARADLITGGVFILLGLAVAYAAWEMPRFANRGVHPWVAPGVVPLLLGGLLALCGALLGWRAAKQGALGKLSQHTSWRMLIASVESRRLWAMIALALMYTLVLLGWLPFWLATGLYVWASIVIFETVLSDKPRRLWRSLVLALLQAVLVAAIVTLVFQYGFLVRLP